MSTVRCRSCRSTAGELVLDLGRQPACEYFPPLDAPEPDAVYPLRLWLCQVCGLAQLADDALLPDQPEGVEPAALVEQRRAAVAAAHAAGLLPAGATVVEGATPHGGSWLPLLAELGLGAASPNTRADAVVDGSFGLMHATDQAAALDRLVAATAPDGVLLLQFHSLAAIIRERQWNAVRHGHYAYYSVPALQRMLAPRGLTVSHAWTFSLYGGTVLLAARRGAHPDESVERLAAAELAAGVLDPALVKQLQVAVEESTEGLRLLLADAEGAGIRVHGYSAASRAVALLHLAGADSGRLLSVADAAQAKQGCRMPGTRIPIVSPAALLDADPDLVLMFVSDLLPEVRKALPQVEARGGRWVDAGAGVTQGTTARRR